MSTKNFFWIMGILVFGFAITSHLVQAKPLGAADKRVSDKGGQILATAASARATVVARVYFADQADVNQLAATLDVWEVHHSDDAAQRYAIVLLTPQQSDDLRARGYRIEIDAAKTALLTQQPIAAASQQSGIPGFPCYRTVEETYAAMAKLAADHPTLASWTDIGDSWNKVNPGHGGDGHDIYALVLTNKAKAGPKPKFMLIAAIHAREYTTAEMATRFAEELVAKYNVDPDVTWLLDYFEVHIVPQVNPDGRKIAETGIYWRKNTDHTDNCTDATCCPFSSAWGTDLNRNSSFQWKTFDAQGDPCSITYYGSTAASEPETAAIEQYASSIFPSRNPLTTTLPVSSTTEGVFITLHSYSELVLFPWGWTATAAPDSAQLQTLGRKFGYFNGYQVCNGQRCLYGTSGTTDDFTYGKLGVASYTFEMGRNFFESCSFFASDIIPKNMPALYYAAKAARRPYQNPAGPDSLQVTVAATNVITGKPIALQAVADDTRYNSNGWGDEPTQVIAAARYSVDAPAWITGTQTYSMTAVDGVLNSSVENMKATVATKGWPLGRHTLFVESRDANGNWGVPGAVFVNLVNSAYDVAVAGPDQPGRSLVGNTVSYHLTVTNTGVLTDTFVVTIGVSAWPVTAPRRIGPLAPSVSAPLTVTVTIPPTATLGTSDSVIITVGSQANAIIQAVHRLTTQVIDYLYYFPITAR